MFSILTDNVEAEVCSIALAMDMATQYYITVETQDKQLKQDKENIYNCHTVKQ